MEVRRWLTEMEVRRWLTQVEAGGRAGSERTSEQSWRAGSQGSAIRREGAGPAAPSHLHARLHRACRRFGPGVYGQDDGALHRFGGGSCAAVDARRWEGLGDRRVFVAPGLLSRARRARGGQGSAVGADPRDPTPDREVTSRRDRSGDYGRAAGDRGL